eukprot:TRINITY_DN825_c1_g1_i1.p1 TRINITY_DN825_c1_g1~~TRINITY_DN825_c1_g1_i1.p1  ORF type:complete len:336 (+),score=127.56 TRINITY_DN825_c1_g1_i1:284-1291(+)
MFARGQILGFGNAIDINVTFDDAATRRRVLVPTWHQNHDNRPPSTLYVFHHLESLKGEVIVTSHFDDKKPPMYTEIKMEFVGQINIVNPETQSSTDFSLTTLELESSTEPLPLEFCKVWNYNFPDMPKPYESYNGITSQLRYFLRVTLRRPMSPDVVEEHDIWVQNPLEVALPTTTIKMEVGLEKVLHIEFEYNKKHFHLQDVVLGKIYFLNIKKLQIKHMELSLLKRETSGTHHDNDTITKFEVMDGHPVNGENIPVRVFLAPYQLTPTYRQVHDMFSVRYYLNLVLVADDERRYYKQQEIVLWRKGPNTSSAPAVAANGKADGVGTPSSPGKK